MDWKKNCRLTSRFLPFALCDNLRLIRNSLKEGLIIDQLIELNESRRHTFDQIVKNQDKINGIFYHKARQKYFDIADHVLIQDKREDLWLTPYQAKKKSRINSYLVKTDGEKLPIPVNGSLLNVDSVASEGLLHRVVSCMQEKKRFWLWTKCID